MPGGVVFLVCIPTLSYEHELVFGVPLKRPKKIEKSKSKIVASPKVDLRLKEVKTRAQLLPIDDDYGHVDDDDDDDDGINSRKRTRGYPARSKTPAFVSMETVKYKKHHY